MPVGPWHPIHHPGLCGFCGTMGLLLILYMTIHIVTVFKMARIEGNNVTEDISLQGLNRSKRSVIVGITTVAPYLVRPMQTTGVFVLTQGRNEKIHCDPVASYCSPDWICVREQELTSSAVYFCKDPCAWSDVKAHTATNESYRRGMGLDNRFTVTKDRQVGRWMTVFISSVQSGDAGTYWCALDLRGKDWYQKITVVVTKPPPDPLKVLQQDVTQTIDDDEVACTALSSGTDSDRQKAARRAMKMCGGNKACALAVLQRHDLGVNTSCWLCIQLSHAWKVIPLLTKHINETVCHIPGQMTRLLQAQDSLLKGKVPKRTTLNCSTPLLTTTSSSPFRVETREGEVCVCNNGAKLNVGDSECKSTITIRNYITNNCSADVNGIKFNFTCPFDRIWETSPAAVWVCGDRAYHRLPTMWSGCCYPALMSVGTTVYAAPGTNATAKRAKRQLSTELMGTMPVWYNGYHLYNPWTTPAANLGWSLLIGGGTAAAINKINGLAWSVLALANLTESALSQLNDEVKQIRDAVVQNRLALDLLLSEKGGVCKLLSISCCFHLPDYHDNVTDLINHMKLAIATPPKADDSWFAWLTSLWGGWGYWLIHTCLPVALGIILLIVVLPCCLRCFSSLIWKAVTRTVTLVNTQRRPDKEYEMPELLPVPSFVPKPPPMNHIIHFTDSDSE